MFRRRWSGLPDDPKFPTNLDELGYYINDQDEIRSKEDPKYYFKYFLTMNERHNDRQRFCFNLAVQDVIHERLTTRHNLIKIPLPLPNASSNEYPAAGEDNPHSPIFISHNLHKAKRVVVIFGERDQDLGVLAHRVVGGAGGLDEGSMVSIVQALRNQKTPVEGNDQEELGIVLANTGETYWWSEGRRPLSYRQRLAVPMSSAAMRGVWFDERRDGVPGSRNADEHVQSVFEGLLSGAEIDVEKRGDFVQLVGGDAVIEVIGLTDGAAAAERYLDKHWDRWSGRIGCIAMVGGGEPVDVLKNEDFKKFIKEKCRAYINTVAPLATPIANSGGNPNTVYFTSYGCPVFSTGEPYYTELSLIKAKSIVLPWMEEVRKSGAAYVNPKMVVTFRDTVLGENDGWEGEPWERSDEDGGGDMSDDDYYQFPKRSNSD